MRIQDYDKGKTFQARVLANTLISSPEANDEVRELTLEVQEHSFEYSVGQSVGVIVPGIAEIGYPHHFRLYTVADTYQTGDSGYPHLKLCIKRCNYIDEYSGELFQGVASNFLCDRLVGDSLNIKGPFGTPFPVPQDKSADLLLIGMGTGIAPFRAFIRHIYQDIGDWQGHIKLFYGAKTGLELIYMNDHQDDFSQYYDEQTFEAIKALSPRGNWDATGACTSLDNAIQKRAEEVLNILNNNNGYIYVVGLKDIEDTLDRVFAKLLGSTQDWTKRKTELKAQERWIELIY
jgi:ferredoxin--NADP+ reductase